ncbi:MAG: SWIM zinc finger family protein [Pyrinomonadaceae bacterium MAG19_C2-C3]|nr:SWIM zinc finger family protein [Pyrinomonadaceae bacterium MAG19_C2-C3]
MSDNLLNALRDNGRLRELAGEKFYGRGERYFADGAVRSLVTHAGKLGARVEGTEDYTVVLWSEAGTLRFSCSCPVGEDDLFCKHCVAVALCYVDVVTSPTDENDREDKFDEDDEYYGSRPKIETLDEVADFLATRSKGQVIELLMEVALESDGWRARLKRLAGKSRRR